MAYFPSSEQVALAYLKTLDALDPMKIATSLPGDPSSWAETGFVQAQTVGGSPAVDTPLYAPVVQIDCWANNPNSQKPPWGKATHLAGAVVFSTYGQVQQLLGMPENFYNVRLLSAYPVSEPRRITGDDTGFARVSVDMVFRWVLAGVNP